LEFEASKLEDSYQLLLKVAENIRLPLLQILLNTQLSLASKEGDLKQVEDLAKFSIRMIDNFILSSVTANNHPILEPLSLSSVLYDSAHELEQLAKYYDVKLKVISNNNFGPVLSNRVALESSLISVGWAMIESMSSLDKSKTITLASHRSRYGLVAGVYSEDVNINSNILNQGLRNMNSSKRPMPDFSHTNSAGIFIAKQLLSNMDMRLLASKHHNLRGIGTLMNPSKQLQLIEV